MLSIIIPSRNEPFLQKTVTDIFEHAEGDVEVIVVLDGYWPEKFIDDNRLRIIHHGEAKGMRRSITEAASIARGEFLMKLDAHCMLAQGFDTVLAAECEPNWVVIPRRKRLDAEQWCLTDTTKLDVDYEYLSFPDNPNDFGGPGLNGRIWDERTLKRKDILLDENLSFQGSCWFMHTKYFFELELMDEINYGTFWNEAQEIGLKCWLSGGKVMVNKKTWYAHLHKGKKMGRGYHLDKKQLDKGATYTKRWIYEFPLWHKQVYPLSWLIERFAPLPGWPSNWQEQLTTLMP